ncbi:MAG TPA: flagellar hook-length control protein FliK, partial [Thermotoga naphthophila]|nr:flagellar hook-length control protein FliK [Thermotoga petrophila]
MDVWKVLGRYSNVLVLSRKNSILILEINGKAPKPGESVRVWNNKVMTGKELKARLLAHFDEELSLKVLKVPGLLEFLHDISRGFDKKYVHFVKLFMKYLVPSRFLKMNDEEKKIIMKSLPEVFESGPSSFRIRFSVKSFFEYVQKNFPINRNI